MAQGTTITSSGTNLSSEGSGTQSAIMSALHALHRMVLEWPKKTDDPGHQKPEPDTKESDGVEPVAIDQIDTQPPALTGQAHAGQLPPSKEQVISPQAYAGQLPSANNEPPGSQPIVVDLKIGSFQARDTVSNIDAHLSDIDAAHQRALGIAMTGGLPDREVSMTAKRDDGEVIHFNADSQENSGWSVESNAHSQNFTASEMNDAFEARSGDAVDGIRSVMTQTFDGDGPHEISGTRFTISMDADQVLVTENETGRIVDAVGLDEVSNTVLKASQEVNGRDRSQQALEAVADYRSLGGAAVSPIPPNKQKELTL